MSLEYKIINPLEYKTWDQTILQLDDYSVFHSSAWLSVLSETYGYKPICFCISNNNKSSFIMPGMEIRNPIIGAKFVSLPFSDYCTPLGDLKEFDILLPEIIENGKILNWKYIEWRDLSFITAERISSSYYGHILELTPDIELIFKGFSDTTRRNTRKATKAKVVIRTSDSMDSVKEFYRLHCITRRRHGLPPQPFHFFKKIHFYMISKQKGIVALAIYDSKVIAGTIFFLFGNKVIYKYAASDKDYQHFRPNNLLIWEMIKLFKTLKFKTLCFGRTDPNNKGLRHFKLGWGTQEWIINYSVFDIRRQRYTIKHKKNPSLLTQLFKIAPIPILRGIGSVLYKYIG